MIPIADTLRTRKTSVITKLIVIVNVLMFFHELGLGNKLNRFLLIYGVIPLRYTHTDIAGHFNGVEQLIPFFTSLFLHGGWIHLIGNMWVLWIFGDNVEERMGHLRFLMFYLAFGLAGGIVHVLTNPNSPIPTIGASGCIAGVTGAYFVLFPYARVLTAVPIFFFIDFWEIPAPIFFGFWFMMQWFNGAMSLASSDSLGGVAWWAHIGGFLTGMLVGFVVRIQEKFRRKKREPEWEDFHNFK